MTRLFSILLLAQLSISCWPQASYITLDTNTLGEGELTRRATFDGNSLWGYINGGADIYLEYGFKTLIVHEIEYKSNPLRFDLYQMSDPKAAFGIFSVYSFQCDSVNGPGLFNCATKWQIQAVKNDFYLSAILPTGSRDEFIYSIAIANTLFGEIEEVDFRPGFPFDENKFSSINANIRYCRGPIGLDNGIAFRNDALSTTGFSELWHITGIENLESVSATVIMFRESGHTDMFISLQNPEDADNLTIFRFDDELSLLLIYAVDNDLSLAPVLKWFTGLKMQNQDNVN